MFTHFLLNLTQNVSTFQTHCKGLPALDMGIDRLIDIFNGKMFYCGIGGAIDPRTLWYISYRVFA